MTLELLPLCTITANLREPFALTKTPSGDRLIFEVESGRVEGERLTGTVKGSANADWLTVGPDGTGTLDVRVLMETDDGALVFVQYQGRLDLSAANPTTYVAPRFETGDERYRWLNTILAAGKGQVDGQTIRYELYELR